MTDNNFEGDNKNDNNFNNNNINVEPTNVFLPISENSNNKPNKKKLKLLFLIISMMFLFFLIFIFILFKLITGVSDTENNNSQNTAKVTTEFNTSAEDIVVNKAKETLEKANLQLNKSNIIKEYSIPNVNTEIENEIKETNTYTNNVHNISFEYPTDWVEIYQFQLKNTPKNVKNIVMMGYPPESVIMNNMRITIEGTPISITSKEYFRETEERMKEIFPEFTSVNSGEITVSGREAPTRIYFWTPQEDINESPYPQEWRRIQQYQVYVSSKEKVYIITFTSTVENFSKLFNSYKKVLDTIQLD